ncbi:hypothetical protein DRO33_04485, partial [Candidatus Bathyarchaeota archaeon]
MRPRVSVVVSTHNRHKDCNELLESLARQTVKPYEVVLIDDASEPPYRPRTGGLRVKFFRSDQELGVGLARLLGSLMATGDVVAFIDDDAIAPENWVERIQKGYKHGFHIWGGPALPIYLAKRPRWWDERVLGIYCGVFNRILICCNYVVRREVFELIGSFKPYLGRFRRALISNEEAELTLRAVQRGLKIGYDHGLVVYHKVRHHEMRVPRLLKRAWDQGLSTYLTTGLNLRLVSLGRGLSVKKFAYGPQGPIKLSARMIRAVLLLTTLISYLAHALVDRLG